MVSKQQQSVTEPKTQNTLYLPKSAPNKHKLSHEDYYPLPAARGISIFETAATRCFTVTELINLLSPESTPLSLSASPPSLPPRSGALFLYNRRITKNYKDDGHDWVRKSVPSQPTSMRVREDNVKLRLDGQFRVAGWYARSARTKTMRRRAYYLLNPADLKPKSDWVLIHYLDTASSARRKFEDQVMVASDNVEERARTSDLTDVENMRLEVVCDHLRATSERLGTKRNRHMLGKEAEASSTDAKRTQVEPSSCKSIRDYRKRSSCCAGNTAHVFDDTSFTFVLTDDDDDDNETNKNPTKDHVSLCPQDGDLLRLDTSETLDKRDSFCSDSGTLFGEAKLLCKAANQTVSKHVQIESPFFGFKHAPRTTEEELAKEWEDFTELEKHEVLSDIYGSAMVWDKQASSNDDECTNPLSKAIKEEINNLRLQLLDNELEKIPQHIKATYLNAQQRCPKLASSHQISKWFLHCENFCPKAAALRLVKYWTKRQNLFGLYRAFLPLTLNGALAEDYEQVASGYARLLPGTDASGRGILFLDNTKRCSFTTQLRCIFYMAHAALENESIINNGLVVVVFGRPHVEHITRKLIRERQQFFHDILPLKVRSIHKCHFRRNEDPIFAVAQEVANYTAGRHVRARILHHEGTSEQVAVKLAEYGISMHQLPSQIGGSRTDSEFKQWLAGRKAMGR